MIFFLLQRIVQVIMERGMSRKEPEKPTPQQIVAFNQACLQLNNIADAKQWLRFAAAASVMQQSGWSDVQIVNQLWTVRPDVRPQNTTPEEAVIAARKAEEVRRQQRQEYPFGQLIEELEFHTSIIQRAAEGENVLVRGRKPHINNLPFDVSAADPRRPFYLRPGELFRAQVEK